MPIYEYACTTCQYEHEALQSISDDPLTECPNCGHDTLQKRVSAAGFRLKGGGWYETDFKSGSKRNVADSGSASTSKSSNTGSSSTKASTASSSSASSASK